MKKKLKLIIVSLVLTFISCEKTDLTQNEANTTASKPYNPPNEGIGYTDVKSLYINNGLTSNGTCTKNILVFPSWGRYNQVIDYLDQQTETYCDAFDAQWGYLPDEEYDVKCDLLGFDEDNKLLQLENNFTFCSLRKKLNALEDAWLAAQGDGVWDGNADPDNHFIDDDTERALLNEGVEVIIGLGTRMDPYKIYKFNADGSYYVISNMNTTVLQQINNGTYVAGSSADVIKVIDPKPVPTPDCKYEVKDKDYEYDPNGVSKIQWKAKSYQSIGVQYPSQNSDGTWTMGSAMRTGKFVAKTRSFKKRSGGGWKTKRAWITAGIQGTSFVNCTETNPLDVMKERRRRKVKVKKSIPPFDGILPTLRQLSFQDNLLYSRHIKGTINFSKDYYDMPNN
jgi:hypothetical protein